MPLGCAMPRPLVTVPFSANHALVDLNSSARRLQFAAYDGYTNAMNHSIGHPIVNAGRDYDDGKLIGRLGEQYRIKPLIDIRNTWQGPDSTRLVTGMENVNYDWQGTVRGDGQRTRDGLSGL